MIDESEDMAVACTVIRWGSDDPQPGWVEAQLTDAEGRVWKFIEKTPLVGGEVELTPETTYPVSAWFPCVVLDWKCDLQGEPIAVISLDVPSWNIESVDGRSEFVVHGTQLLPRG